VFRLSGPAAEVGSVEGDSVEGATSTGGGGGESEGEEHAENNIPEINEKPMRTINFFMSCPLCLRRCKTDYLFD